MTKTTSFRLPPETLRQIEEAAEREERSRAQIIVRAIREYHERHHKDQRED